MNSHWSLPAKILTGFFVTAVYALPQAYTISAKPGAINFVEGTVLFNGQPVSSSDLKSVFLNANGVLETAAASRAEVLLTPGVFLRIGQNSQIRMIAPSLIDTQVEIQKGEAMLEVDELVKENHISIVDRGSSIAIQKDGLYRFTAGDAPTAAVIEGKAEILGGEKKVGIGKGHEALLGENSKTQKFDTKKEDELFAWSNVRSQYNASLSYQASRSLASASSSLNGFNSYGYNGFYTPGWYFNSGFNSWLWMPGNAAFFSPFGWGFYGPGLVAYAPVIMVPTYGVRLPGTKPVVPVNPAKPPVVAMVSSPAAMQASRAQVVHSIGSNGGFRTASGAPAPSFTQTRGNAGAQPVARASSGGGNSGGGNPSAGASRGSSPSPSMSSMSPSGGFHGGAASAGGGSKK